MIRRRERKKKKVFSNKFLHHLFDLFLKRCSEQLKIEIYAMKVLLVSLLTLCIERSLSACTSDPVEPQVEKRISERSK